MPWPQPWTPCAWPSRCLLAGSQMYSLVASCCWSDVGQRLPQHGGWKWWWNPIGFTGESWFFPLQNGRKWELFPKHPTFTWKMLGHFPRTLKTTQDHHYLRSSLSIRWGLGDPVVEGSQWLKLMPFKLDMDPPKNMPHPLPDHILFHVEFRGRA